MIPSHGLGASNSKQFGGAVCSLSLLGIIAIVMISHAQSLPAPPMSQQAQVALQRPLKVDIIPAPTGKIGESLPAKIVLQNGKGQPTAATQDLNFEVTVVHPSGSTSKSMIHFANGESAKQLFVDVKEPGITKLSVRQTEDVLIGSSNYTLITARKVAAPKKRSKPAVAPSKPLKPTQPPTGGLIIGSPAGRPPRFVMASYAFQEPVQVPSGPGRSDTEARLMLKVSGENDAEGIRADGKTSARVQVFYLGYAPPSSGVKIWLRWTNGEVDTNPLIIQSGHPVAEAQWTSRYPIFAAKVSIAAVYPRISFDGPVEATVRFAEPILGIDFVNPPDRISIVDSVTLAARFFDPQGYPIQTSTKRPVRFASNTPVLRLNPEHDEVAPGMSEFVTVVLPTSLGASRVEVSTPGYRPVSHQIVVVGLTVALLCLIGGIAGGVLAFVNSQGKLWARILTGVLVGAVASWAYVYIGLPNITTVILHSQLSVLFISILAAFGGTKVIGLITKALGLEF